MATMTEEERRKLKEGQGKKPSIGIQTPTAEQVGKSVRSFIPNAISKTNDFVRNTSPVREIYDAADMVGRFSKGFFGGGNKAAQKNTQPGVKPDLATMPGQQPKRGEAQAATLTDSPVTPVSNPVQDIAATQKKRTFSPQQQPRQGIAKPSQFGGQFRPVPQRAGGGQMIEWYKDGEVPGYSYVDTPEAKAFNEARDKEFGPMQVAPEDQLKKQLLTATPEQSKGIEQKLATMEGRTQQQSLTPGKVAEMEANVNEGYNAHFSNAAMPQNPTDYLDADMKKPIDKKFWLYKNSPSTARTLYGAPDAETEALLSINAYPDQWQSYLNKAGGEKQNVLQRIIDEMLGR